MGAGTEKFEECYYREIVLGEIIRFIEKVDHS